MSKSKKLCVSIIIFTIFALCISFIALDFTRFFGSDYYSKYYPSAILKRITVVLAAVTAWIAGKDKLTSQDNRIMKLVFLLICSAEAAFLLGKFIAGVALFGVCQSLLTFRNGRGLINKLAYADRNERTWLRATGAIVIISLAAMTVISYRVFGLSKQLLAAWLYGAVLSTSLWAGLANNILGLLPKVNSRMIAGGMFCFYCCDILVGLDAVMEVGLAWLAVNSFIWIFYTPAITLLALSCYKYENPGIK